MTFVDKSSENPTLDASIYQQLRDDMGEDFEELLDAFYSSIQSDLNKLKNRNEETPVKEIIRFAHSMKSAAANLGALRLSMLAATLEHALGDGQVDDMDNSVTQLWQEYEKVKSSLVRL